MAPTVPGTLYPGQDEAAVVSNPATVNPPGQDVYGQYLVAASVPSESLAEHGLSDRASHRLARHTGIPAEVALSTPPPGVSRPVLMLRNRIASRGCLLARCNRSAASPGSTGRRWQQNSADLIQIVDGEHGRTDAVTVTSEVSRPTVRSGSGHEFDHGVRQREARRSSCHGWTATPHRCGSSEEVLKILGPPPGPRRRRYTA